MIKANRINNTKHLGDKFEDFCPGAGKNLDCSATGDLIYLTDAFYGGVDEVVYRYYYGRKTKIEGGAFEF